MKVFYTNTNLERHKILSYLKEQKLKNPNYRIIDIGGAVANWAGGVSDCIVDINATGSNNFRFNLSIESDWAQLLEYVNQNGKFHFAICTHTIEDIANPRLLLEMLPKIANQGVITAPSILTECSNVESPSYLGYIHHRHLIGIDADKIILAPKLNFIYTIIPNNSYTVNFSKEEISIFWEKEIKFEMIMNDYLGPNIESVVNTYKKFIYSNIDDIKNFHLMRVWC